MSISNHSRGISVVEIVVAAAIIATVVTGIAGAWQLYIKVSNKSILYAQSAALVEEGGEVLNILRDTSWTTKISPLFVNTTYYLYWSGTAYSATTTLQTTSNGLVRTIVFQTIARDGSDNISSSGTVDANTRKALITVFASSTPSLILAQSEMLLHNVFNN